MNKNVILEVACFVTNSNMDVISRDFEVVIHHPKEVMDTMDAFCTRMHGQSGLTDRVLLSEAFKAFF